MLLAPVTQLPLLALCAGAIAAWQGMHGPPAVAAVLLVIVLALATRAMHLDGLADTADGFTSSYDRERSLQVMRSGDIGPAGVAAVTLVLLLQVATLGALLAQGPGPALLGGVAVLASRQSLAGACVYGLPAADDSGLGATVAGSVPRAALAGSAVAMLLLALLPGLAGTPWWAGPVVVLGAWAAAYAVVRRARQRLGGITGDILGALIEIGLASGLTVAALVA